LSEQDNRVPAISASRAPRSDRAAGRLRPRGVCDVSDVSVTTPPGRALRRSFSQPPGRRPSPCPSRAIEFPPFPQAVLPGRRTSRGSGRTACPRPPRCLRRFRRFRHDPAGPGSAQIISATTRQVAKSLSDKDIEFPPIPQVVLPDMCIVPARPTDALQRRLECFRNSRYGHCRPRCHWRIACWGNFPTRRSARERRSLPIVAGLWISRVGTGVSPCDRDQLADAAGPVLWAAAAFHRRAAAPGARSHSRRLA
jgi:hypothetical protein